MPDLTTARRLGTLLAAFALSMGAASVDARSVCSTDIGWCEPADASAELGDACACSAGDRLPTGSVLSVDAPNPFLELETPNPEQATRALPNVVSATRGFSGPTQFPPHEFSAYGIVAFKRRASSFDRDRHLMVCQAYLAGLPHTSEVSDTPEGQMVTIWPIEDDNNADRLNALGRDEICEDAVEHYGLVQAQNALRILEQYSPGGGSYDLDARGPFLIAWAPTNKILEEGSAALVLDLSDADSYEEIIGWMDRWRERIQENEEMWSSGFDETAGWDKLRGILRDFFDENGTLVRFGK